MNYGNEDKQQLINTAAHVATVISSDSSNHSAIIAATTLLLETACAETLLGNLKDPTPTSAGSGITQIDESTFNWIIDKYKNRKVAIRIKDMLGINLSTVKYEELNTDNKLAFVITRLRYETIAAPIPNSINGRAAYWKKYYNTKDGAGTVQEYINKAKEYLGY